MGGSAVRLPRQIPYTVAADLLLTGRHVTRRRRPRSSASSATSSPTAQALDKAHELADLIAANGPLAVQAILGRCATPRASTRTSAGPTTPRVGAAVFASEDAKEGPRAFWRSGSREFKGR